MNIVCRHNHRVSSTNNIVRKFTKRPCQLVYNFRTDKNKIKQFFKLFYPSTIIISEHLIKFDKNCIALALFLVALQLCI